VTVISVDLAYKDYRDVGLVVLQQEGTAVSVVPIGLESVGLKGKPDAGALAEFVTSLAGELGAAAVLIDGPQAWKSPTNGLEHCRKCEHDLSTPGKTGLPSYCKPANYLDFTAFSISLFDALATLGLPRLATTGDWPTHVAVETFPTAAWRGLGIKALPGKTKSTPADVEAGVEALRGCFDVDLKGPLNHDELQAAVAGFAGLALEGRRLAGLAFAGVEPFQLDGTWREGYILNPTRDALTDSL
jgi:hypothetical protein